MARSKLRYSDFVDRIDIDALEAALPWEPEQSNGVEDTGFCLWPENHTHGDTTGKFSINRDKRVYNCFVCGGGSLLSLAMLSQDMDEHDALSWLAQFAGDSRSDTDFLEDFYAMFEDAEHRADTLPYFNKSVLSRWPGAQDKHLAKWQIDAGTAFLYDVRYAEAARRGAPSGGKYADDPPYTGPALVFPHFWQGRLVGWQQRWLDDNRPDWIPKYTNTVDFPKEFTLFGMDQLELCDGQVLVVESAPTVIRLKMIGWDAVATFGSSPNSAQLRLLRRFPNGVWLAPDNDKEGQKFLSAATSYLSRYVPVYHVPPVTLSEKADLSDIPTNDGLLEHLGEAERVA
jgi:hypothetical protein